MILLGLILGMATVFLAGFGVTMLLTRKRQPQNALESACLSWLFGAGIVSLLLWSAGFFLHGDALLGAVTLACLALGFAGWLSQRKRRLKFNFPIPANATEWALAGIIALEMAAALFLIFHRTLGWDGSFNWELKARFAFLNEGIMPAAYYSSIWQVESHPEYPLLIPQTELWLYLWMGVAHQFWVKIVFATYYLVGTLLLAILGARLSGRRWIGGLAAALLVFIPYVARGAGGITSGYVDFPLGVLYLAAIGYLLLYQKTGEQNSYHYFAAALTFLPWLKREGAILWLVAAACAALIIWQRKRAWSSLLALLPGLLIALAWKIFLRAHGTLPSNDFAPASWSTLIHNLDRVGAIAQAVLSEFAHLETWSLFWLLVAAAIVFQIVRQRDLALLVRMIALLAPIAAYSAIFIFSAWPDFQSHLRVSLPRLFLHVTPVAWLSVAMALRQPAMRLAKPASRVSATAPPPLPRASVAR